MGGICYALGLLNNTSTPYFVYLAASQIYHAAPCPKPPWNQQNDTFMVDIAGFLITWLTLFILWSRPDPFWACQPPAPALIPRPRPPPHPNPVLFHRPLTYSLSLHVHHASLHRLHHLHQLESRHLRLLARHRRLPAIRATHLLLHFRPAVPKSPYPPWTDEGGFNKWPTQWFKQWIQPSTILQVHPTIAKSLNHNSLTYSFKSIFGLGLSDGNTAFDVDVTLDTASKPFGIDPMASATISNDKNEFLTLRPLSKTYLAGVGGKVPVEGIGTILWDIEDDLGMKHQIKVNNAYYCSQAPLRLLCPQQWAAQREKHLGPDHNTKFTTTAHFSRLQWSEYCLTVPHDDATNLPLWRTAPGYHDMAMNVSTSPQLTPAPAVVSDDEDSDSEPGEESESIPRVVTFPFEPVQDQQRPQEAQGHNQTLSNDQLELLKLHNKLGHVSFNLMKNMAKQGLIPSKFANVEPPKCSSCLYGKQTKRPWRTKAKSTSIGGRKPTRPGECVSVDQLISKTPGLIAQVKGRLTKQRYHAATVFADHASGLTYVHVSEGTTADETLEAKAAFESYAADMGVAIKHYHADNGRFAENAFMEQVKTSGQTITFCGVGAHHQNGVAERRIRDITEHARTMLLHAAHRWPKAINVHLWPYALRMAAHIRNHIPRESEGGVPIQLFSNTEAQNKVFTKHQHTFGCPVYVLEAPLQSGLGSKPKWSERSRVGAYLGYSHHHYQTVALVLNLNTGHVSPQFHVVFDDEFDTVGQDYAFESAWQGLADLDINKSESSLVEKSIDPKFQSKWYKSIPHLPQHRATDHSSSSQTTADLPAPIAPIQEGPPPLRRSPRIAEQLARKNAQVMQDTLVAHNCRLISANTLEDGTMNEIPPHSFVSSVNNGDPDTMHYGDARKQADWADFQKAMVKEVNDFDERGHWELVHKTSIDFNRPHDIISAIWSFKRKRTPAGELIKHKARLCAHGGQQTEGVTYWDTFAPVVNWNTLRIFLTLALIRKWKARSVDFVLAYPQADLTKDIYMRIPKGFSVSQPGDYLLKLKKNIYGLKDAGRTWHEHLKKGLLARGFEQGKVDPCVFYRGNLILLIYVDDVICFCPEDKPIDDFIESMQKAEPRPFVLEDQGPLKDYLGIEIKEAIESKSDESNRTIHVTQPHLIAKILKTCGLDKEHVNPSAVPAAPSLRLNKSGKECTSPPFNYRSAIGQLNYLAATTRPELAFAVHQCARFCADPKEVHYKAVKRIARYLSGTKDKGLTLRPSDVHLHCYADADFAGNYTPEDSNDPNSVKSRSGFVIMYAGCPIAWQSKLQTEIALSTTESEYISLSQATRTMLFLIELFKEIKDEGFDFVFPTSKVFATCFEDNAGCLELAKAPKLRPRTKHIAVKYHHFRSHVFNEHTNPDGCLHLRYVGTKDQLADIFTKGLNQVSFEKLRAIICGW